jgi:hypothetical protein
VRNCRWRNLHRCQRVGRGSHLRHDGLEAFSHFGYMDGIVWYGQVFRNCPLDARKMLSVQLGSAETGALTILWGNWRSRGEAGPRLSEASKSRVGKCTPTSRLLPAPERQPRTITDVAQTAAAISFYLRHPPSPDALRPVRSTFPCERYLQRRGRVLCWPS